MIVKLFKISELISEISEKIIWVTIGGLDDIIICVIGDFE